MGANSSLPSIGTLPVHGGKEQYIVKFDIDFGTISAISFTSRSKSKRFVCSEYKCSKSAYPNFPQNIVKVTS